MALPRTTRPGLLLALVAALGACHAAPPSSSRLRPQSLLSDRAPPAGRECRISAVPAELPAVDQLVDSTALHAQLVELQADGRRTSGYAILSLIFDRNGWSARRMVIEHDLAAPVADSVQQLVFANLRQVSPGEGWGVRLRMDLQQEPLFRVGRQEICAPRLRNAPELRNATSPFDVRSRDAPDIFRRIVWVHVLVDASGAIADARMPERTRGLAPEDQVLSYIRSLSFDPALADGVPIPGWTRVPLPVAR